MPVGTYGTVKGVLPGQLRGLGAQIILGNTFHLALRPGLEVIAAHGGLHGFARWAERSRRAHEGNDAALFGIVQGGIHHDLRTQSAQGLIQIGFDGYAIGGLAVGETEAERNAMLEHTCPH